MKKASEQTVILLDRKRAEVVLATPPPALTNTRKDRAMDRMDITGQRFGRLLAIRRFPDPNPYSRWLCKCDCGREKVMLLKQLRRRPGGDKSCGCSGHSQLRHGGHRTRLYRIWRGMIQRCYSPKNDSYGRYGARGIVVASEWRDFAAFQAWAKAHGYAETLSIDRIDSDGNYEPSNCRWATDREQQRNRSNTRFLTYDGERLPLVEWASRLGMKPDTLGHRVDLGWDDERALTTPVKIRRNA